MAHILIKALVQVRSASVHQGIVVTTHQQMSSRVHRMDIHGLQTSTQVVDTVGLQTNMQTVDIHGLQVHGIHLDTLGIQEHLCQTHGTQETLLHTHGQL